MAASPASIPSDAEILMGIHEYLSENQSFPNEDGGMNVFVQNYLLSNADPELVRQRMDTLQRDYLATRQPLSPSLPRQRQRIYALSQHVWSQSRLSDSETTSADETSLSGPPPVLHDSTSLDRSSSIHGRQDVDHQSSPLDQTNQATSSRAGILHYDYSDSHTPTGSASAAENTPEMSYSADQSTNVSSAEDTPGAGESSNNTTPVSSGSKRGPISLISSNTRRRLFDLNQQGQDTTAANATQDINILTRMVAYFEANHKAYPYDSVTRLSDFVKNWLHSDADPGEVGKRIQELREMYGKYLMMNNNNDESGKPVYSDSPDDRLLLELSKKLWHHEFGNANDDSAGGKSSGAES